MKVTLDVDLTPGEVEQLPKLLGKSVEDLVREAVTVHNNKQALLRFQDEVFNGHDWSLETLSKHLTEDFVDHAAMPGDLPGLEGVQSRFSAWQAAFEGAAEENLAMVGEGDLVAVLYDLHARHEGEYLGISPTHQPVVIPGIEFVRFKDGKISEHWGIYDFMTTAEEIGAELSLTPKTHPGIPKRPQIPWDSVLKKEGPAEPGS